MSLHTLAEYSEFKVINEIEKMHKLEKKTIKRAKSILLTSTVDPYDTSLKWWDKKPIKYA